MSLNPTGLPSAPEHPRHAEAPDVGVQHAHLVAVGGQRRREVHRDRGLADAALARGDRDDRGLGGEARSWSARPRWVRAASRRASRAAPGSSASATPRHARRPASGCTAAVTSCVIRSRSGHPSIVSSTCTRTFPPSTSMRSSMPMSSIGRPISGSFTPRRASRTCCLGDHGDSWRSWVGIQSTRAPARSPADADPRTEVDRRTRRWGTVSSPATAVRASARRRYRTAMDEFTDRPGVQLLAGGAGPGQRLRPAREGRLAADVALAARARAAGSGSAELRSRRRRSRTAIIPEDRKALFKERGEVDFAYSVANVGRFRANVFRQRGSVSMVLRKLRFGGPSLRGDRAAGRRARTSPTSTAA